MIRTIITLVLVGGFAMGATIFKLGTTRGGRSYFQKIKKMRSHRRGGRYYGGGPRHGK